MPSLAARARSLAVIPHRVAIAVLALTTFGFALRLFRLDHQPIWWDEAYSLDLARRGFLEATVLTAGDIHPPLHYWILTAWIPLAGESEFALRFQSAAFGLLLVPLLYQLGRLLFGKPAGVVVAGLAAIAAFHVAYAQEARMYTLQAALSVASVWLMVRLLQHAARDEDMRRTAALYAVVTSLALWADYFPIFVIIAQNVFVLLWIAWWAWQDEFDSDANPSPYRMARLGSGPSGGGGGKPAGLFSLARRQALRLLPWWLGANALAALLYLPWVFIAWVQVTGYGVGRISTPPLGDMLLSVWAAYFVGQTVEEAAFLPWLIVGLVTVVLALLVLFLAKPKPAWWSLAYLVIPLLVFLAILIWRPFFNERYAFVATPALLLALGAGAACPLPWGRWGSRTARLARRAPLLLVVPFLLMTGLSLSNHYFDQRYSRDDVRSVLAWLRATTTPQDVVLLQTRHPFSYYATGTPRLADTVLDAGLVGVPASVAFIDARPATTPADLAAATAGKQRAIWVTWAQSDTDPWGMVRFLLGRAGHRTEDLRFTGYRAEVYALAGNPGFAPAAFQALGTEFGGALRLNGIAVEGEDGAAEPYSNGIAYVTLQWESLTAMTREYKYYVHLRDEAGHLLSQYDRVLWNDGRLQTDLWRPGEQTLAFAPVPVPMATAPGQYRLDVGVYSDTWGELASSGPRASTSVRVQRARTQPEAAGLGFVQPEFRNADADLALGAARIVGYRVNARSTPVQLDQGEALTVRLLWQVERPIPAGSPAGTVSINRAGAMPGVEAPFTLGAPGQPASEWRPGDLVQQFVSLRAPADLPAGDYEFRIRFGGGPPTVFFPVEIRESERRFRPAPGGTALGLAFGQVAELSSWRAEGYDGTPASGPVTAAQGGPVTWLLDWRALGTPPVNYAVSVQALDHQGRVAGQADEHLRPDSASWVAGQYVSSRHQFGVAAAGDYRVIAVLYDPATGQRVRLADGRDFAELTTLRVCAGATSRC